jgi:thioredoxin 1
MKTPALHLFILLICLLLETGPLLATEDAPEFSKIPEKGIASMVDLGAKKCIPCKMMAPILVKMEKIYEGKANITFIDVWQHRDQAKRFKIRAIPTQIFFDKDGKEVYRHIGFFSEKEIVGQFTKMGVILPN